MYSTENVGKQSLNFMKEEAHYIQETKIVSLHFQAKIAMQFGIALYIDTLLRYPLL